jgi:hypothetical protein
MFVSLGTAVGNVLSTSGILAIIEVEALADGNVELAFEKDVISFLAPDGQDRRDQVLGRSKGRGPKRGICEYKA